jgi:lipopolysaccharide transport system ATP-binding protein
MSSEPAIRVEGLGKRYTIRHQQTDHVTLAQVALERLRHPLRRSEREEFWALRDVGFEVGQGEVLGVIGRNGAGKSTLLKCLSRITAPTTGRIELWGRVGSLLEVGTGFHPELTGRENIYLNGSILGMTRREIDRQFDAIVDFAGVERFLDTPVKRYSSGMYVRLAFAVAAHLETEILLVDEVLAVGDREFQQRCLGKMREVATTGRTVLFVSHQLNSIQALCDRALVLARGRVVFDGGPAAAVAHYVEPIDTERPDASDPDDRPGTGEIRAVEVVAGKPFFDCAEPKVVEFRLRRASETIDRCFIGLVLRNSDGIPIAHCDSNTVGCWYTFDAGPEVVGRFTLAHPWLLPGGYSVDLYVCNAGVLDAFEQACTLHVAPTLPYESPPDDTLLRRDAVLPDFSFTADADRVGAAGPAGRARADDGDQGLAPSPSLAP